tara:strand:+ start:847 stop:1512 length:666 start_codon:yes stop_codon:yes gene_type:complete
VKITDYKSLIFDCDGVVLNSNKIKTKAFETIFQPFGLDIANKMVQYNIKYGGISRYKKIDYFLENYVKNQKKEYIKDLKIDLLKNFSEIVIKKLVKSEVCQNLELLKLKTKNSKWFIVSGGDEKELNYTFKLKKISSLFNGGIYGSPTSKYEIIENEIKNGNIIQPAIYFGDSKLDYEVADFFDFSFAFVLQWTEFDNWKSFFSDKKNVTILNSPAEILKI